MPRGREIPQAEVEKSCGPMHAKTHNLIYAKTYELMHAKTFPWNIL
jgi:hypothetical protein